MADVSRMSQEVARLIAPDAVAMLKFRLGRVDAGALFLGMRGNNPKIVGMYEPSGNKTALPVVLRDLPVEGDSLPNHWPDPFTSETAKKKLQERLEFFTTHIYEQLPISHKTLQDHLDIELVVFGEPSLYMQWSHYYPILQVETQRIE